MSTPWKLTLIPGCRLEEEPPVLVTPRGELSLADRGPVVVDAVRTLLAEGATEEELAARVVEKAGYEGVCELYPLLFELHDRMLVCRRVLRGGEPLLTCVPLSSAGRFRDEGLDANGSYVLSRFAHLRRVGDTLALESPRSLMRVEIHGSWAATLVAVLARPRTLAEISAEVEGEEARQALDLLWQGDFLSRVDAEGEIGEDRDPALRQWSFHDLLFHARTRVGRHLGGYGGTYPFRGRTEPIPALKPDLPGDTVALERPDLDRLRASDLPFTRVLEERRSRREHGERPISLRQLGEFLYRTARVTDVADGFDYEIARRLYPGGGAAYELEVYLLVHRCDGLEEGFYHYRPLAHELVRIAGPTPETARLLEHAAHAARAKQPVQILLLLSARFRRLSWKYESMVYGTVLKDVGGLFQTMYLVATAMGLGACAIGGGDSDLFARAAGTDYYEESSVGEFILGTSAKR